MSIVNCTDLSHTYGSHQALKSVDLQITSGELVGFIGPDGAGKSTLFRIIASLLKRQTGSVKVLGYDSNLDYKRIRECLGYMPGRFSLYHDLTVDENLQFYAAVFGSDPKENYHLIGDIFDQLAPFKKRRAGKLSGGMKQKLALSCALIHKPDLLILDEPTTGVDSVSRIEFWSVLQRLKQTGMTILVSTPYMDEAKLCDQIVLMQKGSILRKDSPKNVIKAFEGGLFAVSSMNRFEMRDLLLTFESVDNAYLFGQKVHFTSRTDNEELLIRKIQKSGNSDFELSSVTPNVEDCFIQLMGAGND